MDGYQGTGERMISSIFLTLAKSNFLSVISCTSPAWRRCTAFHRAMDVSCRPATCQISYQLMAACGLYLYELKAGEFEETKNAVSIPMDERANHETKHRLYYFIFILSHFAKFVCPDDGHAKMGF